MDRPYPRREAGTGIARAAPHNPANAPLTTGANIVPIVPHPAYKIAAPLSIRGDGGSKTAIILRYPREHKNATPANET